MWLVQLDQVREEALVAQAVAGALGLREQGGAVPGAALADYLSDRRLLLVLDNCEHLVEAVLPSWPTCCCARRPGCGCWPPAGNR